MILTICLVLTHPSLSSWSSFALLLMKWYPVTDSPAKQSEFPVQTCSSKRKQKVSLSTKQFLNFLIVHFSKRQISGCRCLLERLTEVHLFLLTLHIEFIRDSSKCVGCSYHWYTSFWEEGRLHLGRSISLEKISRKALCI